MRSRSLAQLNRESLDFLRFNTDGKITMLSPGSTARALVEAANRSVSGLYEAMDLNLASSYLSRATGVYLDLLAEMFGTRRLPPFSARVAASDNAIRFYAVRGTLYDYLPDPQNLNRGYIPQGTQITNLSGDVIYTVDSDTYFGRTATEVFVPATASVVGSSPNVGAFSLVTHSLGISSIKVSNPSSIETGKPAETDGELRTRLSQLLLARQGANETAVRLAVLAAPGVADMQVIPNLFGAGSFDVMIVPTGNRVSAETLQIARRNLDEVVAFGMFYRLREPKYVRFSMVVSLTYSKETFTSGRDAVRTDVERAVLEYMGNLRLGAQLVITELGAVIRAANPGVYDYKIEALCFNGKHQILHNYQLDQDELFLADERLEDPVRIM